MSIKDDEFKERFVAIMQNVRHGLLHDKEAMAMVGETAAHIVPLGHASTWSGFKRRLTQDLYSSVLRQLEVDGNLQHAQGKPKEAYAAQLLATSLVANTQKDKEVRQGVKLLDELIDRTLANYNQSRNVTPVLNRPIA